MNRITWLGLLLVVAGCSPGDDAVLLGTLERDRLELVAEAHEPIVELLVREGDARLQRLRWTLSLCLRL